MTLKITNPRTFTWRQERSWPALRKVKGLGQKACEMPERSEACITRSYCRAGGAGAGGLRQFNIGHLDCAGVTGIAFYGGYKYDMV